MRTYSVSYKVYNSDNVCVGKNSIQVKANSQSDACKKASLAIDGKHSILVASLIA